MMVLGDVSGIQSYLFDVAETGGGQALRLRARSFRIQMTSEPITPRQPLPPLPPIPRGSLVVIEGQAPIWRYAMAFHKLHGSPAAAIAVYDPRLGAVIVASHAPAFSVGQVLDLAAPSQPAQPGLPDQSPA